MDQSTAKEAARIAGIYLSGFAILIFSLPALSDGPLGIIPVLGGIIILPPIRRQLASRWDIDIPWKTSFGIAFLAFGVAITLSGAAVSDQPTAGTDTTTSPTPDTTPTPTPTPKGTHSVGDSFVVGSGEQSVQYTVKKVVLKKTVGEPVTKHKAKGVFVILVLEIKNVGEEPITVDTDHLKLVDSGGNVSDYSLDATFWGSGDPDVEVEQLNSLELNPGLSATRSIAFDVAPGRKYRLRISPLGMFSPAEDHYVRLGVIEME